MNCEDCKPLLPEYWDGTIDEADRLILAAHLERCPTCRLEAEQLREVWSGLGEIAAETPSDQIRVRFYDRLDAYRQGATEMRKPAPRWSVPGGKAAWIGIAAALVVGFFSGYVFDSRKDNVQFSQLRSEVNNMRQLVALSLLQQQKASDRLQGVNWSYRVERSDTEVLSALLYTVNHDPNVNVRLAAVDAMRTFGDSPVARRGLVQAIGKQSSPLVQIALVDQLVELREPSAVPVLQGIMKDPDANPEVKQRAQWAVERIR